MNKGLLRRYFVEFGSSEPNSGFLGAYFWKKAAKTLIWGPAKVNKALFDRYYARRAESGQNNGPKGRYFGGRQRSATVGNGRQQSATVGNSRQRSATVGNGRQRSATDGKRSCGYQA
ncbi:hypothetical protein [Paenibacillus faecis]|uniref:hypothetical protein n=1 Tax=Paenibacillus faecis TaxID=862114 RepID=UPI001BCFAAAF|nr:hypothetical protein [Paenibacillus faecis]